MSIWTEFHNELDLWAAAGRTATIWWRHDGATQDPDALDQLLSHTHGLPIALSVVPTLADRSLADRVAMYPELSVLQHGWRHRTHLDDRDSEYPPGRPLPEIEREFVEGFSILRDLFGLQHVPAFVPPWHRFYNGYARLLRRSGQVAISLAGPRAAAEIDGLRIINVQGVSVELTPQRDVPEDEANLVPVIAHLRSRREGRAALREPTGIVTRHNANRPLSREFPSRLAEFIRSHAAAHWLDLREILGIARERPVPAAPLKKSPLPAIFISYNRGPTLRRAIDGARTLSWPLDIIVHDNGSSDQATLEVLGNLETEGVQVVRGAAISSADELNRIDDTVQILFRTRPASDYIVSDDDIDLTGADPNTIAVYAELLARFDVDCVGPMLTIGDVPLDYPLYDHVMNRHIDQFWSHRPRWVETASGRVGVLDAVIDTTFALHRAGEPFHRLKRGLRVYAPYEARHLDWYPDVGAPKAYREQSSARISHWNNASSERQYRNEPLYVDRYFAVRNGPNGPEEYIAPVPRPKSAA